MKALAVVGALVEELRWMVAVGDVVKTLLGCLSSSARMNPRDLGRMVLCVDLLFALMVGGGGGNMSPLAEAVLWWWYLGYVLIATLLCGVPCRWQLITSGLPVLLLLRHVIAYSLV